jgi:hypothetical protein
MSRNLALLSVKSDMQNVFYSVEADAFARQALWERHQESVKWDDDPMGRTVDLGKFGGMPVKLELFCATINGKLVLFYDCVSLVAHWGMVDDWLKDNIPNLSGRRCNALNFHNCLMQISEDAEKTSKITA